MGHAHVTQLPSRVGATVSSTRRRSQIVRRRRLLLVAALGTILLVLAVLANVTPLRAYSDARTRLAQAEAGVAELSAQKVELEYELGRLSEVDYMESLAREELSYTRPGEELYIVTGAGDGSLSGLLGSNEGTSGQSGSTGFLERVLAPLLD